MDVYWVLKLAHLLGSAVLFGTGLGIVFFMFVAERHGNVAGIGATARTVVLADLAFTTPAVILQPITGVALAYHRGYDPFDEGWIDASFVLYLLVALCWLPVVKLRVRIENVGYPLSSALQCRKRCEVTAQRRGGHPWRGEGRRCPH